MGILGKPSAADAHDAGLVWGCGQKPFAADAHDAGLVWGLWEKPFAAGAHDAGLLGGCGENRLRLMLMMLALFGDLGKTLCG